MWPCASGETTPAASGTRSFRAQSHVLLKMTHSRQILAHRPCDEETDTQAKQFRSSYHTAWRLFGQNPAWPRGSLLLEATYPSTSSCPAGCGCGAATGTTRPGRGDVWWGRGPCSPSLKAPYPLAMLCDRRETDELQNKGQEPPPQDSSEQPRSCMVSRPQRARVGIPADGILSCTQGRGII